MTVGSQRFAEITDATGLGPGYSGASFDGIVGLYFSPREVTSTTVIENAFSQEQVDER
eukprot:CAMPEP_0116564832 /NCGR_PEP_ID=MMETSP0397-20121206/13556_1 /TAXON_ID=216820 /ORGANISM="Cyclophora tenuis, Strain ECT3854" /LENGTH=57 /DNA_ID=CAMNT_0004091527 /DNA_START=125 /DNA_END=295 /DNA_ORIENTATION=-